MIWYQYDMSIIFFSLVSMLLYGCTTWMQTKSLKKRLDGNYPRMLWTILNRSWRQHPTKQQLYSHLPPITKTIKVTWTMQHCWRSRDELISDVVQWTYGRAKAGRPARTYIQQLSEDTGCSPEDLSKAMNDKEGWLGRVRDIYSDGSTRWWDDDEYDILSSSSCAASTDIPDPLSPLFPIIHRLWQVFRATPRILT